MSSPRVHESSKLRRVARGATLFFGFTFALTLGVSCSKYERDPVVSSFHPDTHGLSFENFRSANYKAQQFDADAFVALVGDGPRVCVADETEECVLTEEAAGFAAMVNELRADGHCEGMVVLAAVRFNQGATRKSIELPDDAVTINAIIRSFATMFLPEVQAEARYWMSESLEDLVSVLAVALSEDRMEFGLGVYTPEGGHEVLPYAIEFPSEQRARIFVYDPNWPMQERYLDLNLENDTWTFSFSGVDQAADLHPWTGGRGDIDLNSISVRVKALNARRSDDLDPTGTIWE